MTLSGRLTILPNEIFAGMKLLVVGDIHGDLQSLNKVIEIFDPKKNFLIFLGDYADRGPNGLEVIECIINLLNTYPGRVFAIQGNHESFTINGTPTFRPFSLKQEILNKQRNWDDYFNQELNPFLDRLQLGVLIPGIVLFVHGGLSTKIQSAHNINFPSSEVQDDILWSDPTPKRGTHPNSRGLGVRFGPDVTTMICRRLNVAFIVRSHEPQKAVSGPFTMHAGRIITISTTRQYGGNPFILVLDGNSVLNNLRDVHSHVRYL